tara:strand:+ start:5995 stop:6231 length:237 start_codon:yes stop_codon:yes gene_type:complete
MKAILDHKINQVQALNWMLLIGEILTTGDLKRHGKQWAFNVEGEIVTGRRPLAEWLPLAFPVITEVRESCPEVVNDEE